MSRAPSPTHPLLDVHAPIALTDEWEAVATAPDLCVDPSALDALEGWLPARAPGTAAAAIRDAGLWQPGEQHDFDAEDWWFRTRFDAEPLHPAEEVALAFDGLATVADVYLNGELILESDSMFARHSLDVGALLRDSNELAIRCRALDPLLRARRRPRARWRTRVVAEGNLRFFRTMLLGRAPGFAPGPAAVGPWRPVRLERRRGLAVEILELRPRLVGDEGTLAVRASLRSLDGAAPRSVEMELRGPSGSVARASLELQSRELCPGRVEACGEVTVSGVARWWPHTHGDPALYDVRLLIDRERDSLAVDAGRVGFRRLAFGPAVEHDVLRDGLDLHVNGVRVFVRGAVWTPIDMVGLTPTESDLRLALSQARDAGMNMLRLPGTAAYESRVFHDLCDELGILVWQDFMFANLDYPIADEHFRATAMDEASGMLAALRGRPSLAVLCGNSEVEQQVAMLGLDPSLGRGELFGELLPALVDESGVDAVYIPSAPCGGELPFQTDRGIANYYGVGGYLRPLEDARRADVRFAAECLAFSNVPVEESIEKMLTGTATRSSGEDPVWKTGVPRDVGADWDFEDVRDHYLELLFEVEASKLRRVDHARYLELSRFVTGEVMAEVFGEWRRSASSCSGALVLWLRDLLPGAGWGLVDHRGIPKVAYHYLARALAPVAVWTVDEGLNGVVAHAANDGPEPLAAVLRVALYRDHELRVGDTRIRVELGPHSQQEWNVETLIGHFVDVGWAYRFGPPAQDAIVVSLEHENILDEGEISGFPHRGLPIDDSSPLISQAFRYPAGRPAGVEALEQLGVNASASQRTDGTVCLRVNSRRLLYGVRLHTPGFSPSDDAFTLEPGVARVLILCPDEVGARFAGGTLTALNLQGQAVISAEEAP